MKKFKEFLNKPTLTPEQLSKKWNIPLDKINKLIKDGMKIEKEHTTNPKIAAEIARDHLGEKPNYYKKLKKVENT